MVPIIIRVFMDSRTAFMTHITIIMICASVLQHPLEFIVVEAVAGLVAIFSLRELSSRSQLFWTAVFVTLSAALMNLSLDWIRDNSFTKIDYGEFNYLAINGLLLFCCEDTKSFPYVRTLCCCKVKICTQLRDTRFLSCLECKNPSPVPQGLQGRLFQAGGTWRKIRPTYSEIRPMYPRIHPMYSEIPPMYFSVVRTRWFAGTFR